MTPAMPGATRAPTYQLRHLALAALCGAAFAGWLVAIYFVSNEERADHLKAIERCKQAPTQTREQCMHEGLRIPS